VLEHVAQGPPPGYTPLPIPAIFTDPTPDNAIALDELERVVCAGTVKPAGG
jgi:hypothetical protein